MLLFFESNICRTNRQTIAALYTVKSRFIIQLFNPFFSHCATLTFFLLFQELFFRDSIYFWGPGPALSPFGIPHRHHPSPWQGMLFSSCLCRVCPKVFHRVRLHS